MPDERQTLTTAEVFAGIGSVSTGFGMAGFERLLLTDVDPVARDNFVENFPNGPRYLREDVRHLTVGRVRDAVDGRTVDGLLGCPPCQGFSSAGKRDPTDPQNQLLVDFFRLARGLHVKFFVMENVPALLDQQLFGDQIALMRRWYRVWHGPLNAALYGLPQTRQRSIVIGYHKDLGVEPAPPPCTHYGTKYVFDYRSGRKVRPSASSAECLLGPYPRIGGRRRQAASWLPAGAADLQDLVTVEDAIGDLPADGCEDGARWSADAVSPFAEECDAGATVHNHQPWRHRPALAARMRSVPEGGVWNESRERGYYSQAYARLHRSGLARTVTTNFHNPGSGRFTHYGANRTLTVREAARLQGIPDTFRFVGFPSWQERLVGNAFPLPWAAQLGRQVRNQLDAVVG